jgi:Lrp/AsnC family leucine-responsive transcriptional regulator
MQADWMAIQSNIDDLDIFDHKMIRALSKNGRITVTDLAQQIGLSKTPCQLRLKKLLDRGYIVGFRAVIDPVKLGLEHVAFAQVKLSDTREDALQAFKNEVRGIPEVEECHMIAGSFDYLLKIRTTDIRRYREILGEKISSLPHVESTSTLVAMESVKDGHR